MHQFVGPVLDSIQLCSRSRTAPRRGILAQLGCWLAIAAQGSKERLPRKAGYKEIKPRFAFS